MKLRIFIAAALMVCGATVSGAENYFRPGTVWTKAGHIDMPPFTEFVSYNAVLDEVTFEGERVLPFVYYSDSHPQPELKCYLRTNGDKVFWRSINPDYPTWYLFYDFGLKVDEETTVYSYRRDNDGERVLSRTVRCLARDYYLEDNTLSVPMMTILNFKEDDPIYNAFCEPGEWIVGIGNPLVLSEPAWVSGVCGGGGSVVCVESPKGNIVYGAPPVAGLKPVIDSKSPQPFIPGVYNLQGMKVGDTTDGLPAGLYIVNGKKTILN